MHLSIQIFRYLEQIAQVCLLICLWRRKLIRRYFFFSAYMAVSLVRELALDSVDNHSINYAAGWAISQPFLLLFQALAIIELFRLVLQHYPRTGRFSRWVLAACFVMAALFGSGMALWDIKTGANQPWWLSLTFGGTRWVAWMSCAVLAVQAFWFSLFPIPMRPNVRHHRMLLAWYAGLAPGFMSVLAKLPDKDVRDTANLCLIISEVVCLLAWMLLMRAPGETCGHVPTISPRLMRLLDHQFGDSMEQRRAFRASA